MESNGKYWISIFNYLEQDIHVCLTHPKYVKAMKRLEQCQDYPYKNQYSPKPRKCLRHINSPSPSFMRGIRGFHFSPFWFIIVS